MYRDEIQKLAQNGFGVQGDVPMVRRKDGPLKFKEVNSPIIRRGEVTGHHHILTPTLDEPQFRCVEDEETSQLWVELFANVTPEAPVKLKHQDHNTLVYDTPGWYVVPEQVEYDGQRERRVLD